MVRRVVVGVVDDAVLPVLRDVDGPQLAELRRVQAGLEGDLAALRVAERQAADGAVLVRDRECTTSEMSDSSTVNCG